MLTIRNPSIIESYRVKRSSINISKIVENNFAKLEKTLINEIGK